jgi:cobalt-precorrin 5A hydrolase/precorrin-3B C17-methyltransferase
LKGIAIGLSNNSKEILKRLKKTEFVKDIYIAGSSKDDEKKNDEEIVSKEESIEDVSSDSIEEDSKDE